MLQNIGDKLKSQRWLAYGVLGALGLVFAAWGAYGLVDVGLGTPTWAAKVNGEEISATEMNELWQQQQPQYLQLFGGSLTDEQRNELQQRLLDGRIRSLVAEQQARKLGFGVSDRQLREAFMSEQAFQVEGQFNAAVAREALANVGMTEQAYVDSLRRSLLSNQLVATLGGTDFFTPLEIRTVLALQDEERELRYVLLQPEGFSAGPPIEAAAVEEYYKANAAEFTPPEAVKLGYAELALADVAQQVVVTDEALRERYESDKDSYTEPERRRARHILITVDAETDDAKARALAEDLSKRLAAGEDFAALAKQFSKDSASAQEGGDLGFAARDAYVQPFADALFALQEGQTSAPVKTQFGYHIIRLEAVRAGASRSFEEVRPELTVQLRNDLAADAFGNRQEELQSRIERGGTNLAQLAQEFGLHTGEIERFERGAGGLPLGNDAELNREVFSDALLNQRRVGGPVALGEDRLTIVQVLEHYPPQVKPLEEVRDSIVAILQRQRGSAAAYAAAEAGLGRLAAGDSLEKVAASHKLSASAAQFVARGTPEVPVEIRDAAFALPKPQPGTPQRQALKLEDGTAALVEVTAVRTASLTANPQLQGLRAQRELQRYAQRDVEAYLDALVAQSKIRKNPQAFAQ